MLPPIKRDTLTADTLFKERGTATSTPLWQNAKGTRKTEYKIDSSLLFSARPPRKTSTLSLDSHMNDLELFHQLAIAALTGLSQRQDHSENIARDAVLLAKKAFKEIKRKEEFINEN